MNYVRWPFGVRTRVLREGYVPQPPKNLQSSPMERGEKTRLVSTGSPEKHAISLRLPQSEYESFLAWCHPSKGKNPGLSLPFAFPHPQSQEPRLCRIIPQDGRAYAATKIAGANWLLRLEVSIFPQVIS